MYFRYWRPDLAKEACAVVSQSVEHEGAPVGRQQENGVRAVELGTSFLMEPCGSGRSRLTYIARTDLRWAFIHPHSALLNCNTLILLYNSKRSLGLLRHCKRCCGKGLANCPKNFLCILSFCFAFWAVLFCRLSYLSITVSYCLSQGCS